MKKTFFFALIILILTSCNALKKLKNVTQGNVTEKNYSTEIPFEYYQDLIFIKVTINNKNYNFLFDTGWDLTAISNIILADINHSKTNVKGTSTDAANKDKGFEYLTLENVKIGNINFNNMGAFSDDFTHMSKVLGCLESYDGVIGNNLLRKAKWQIDYKKKVIRFSDKIEGLEIDEKSLVIPMETKNYGHALITVEIDGVRKKFTFDTGFNGKFQSGLDFFSKIKSNKNNEYTVKSGFSGLQSNGETNGDTYETLVENLIVSDITLPNQLISFGKNQASLIGNGFFERYIVTIDWKKKYLYLDQQFKAEKDTLKTYELLFAPNYVTNKIEFYNKWQDHSLSEGIDLKSEIVKINHKDVTTFTTKQLCEFWNSNKSNLLTDKVEIEILENGVTKKIVLNRKQLLPK